MRYKSVMYNSDWSINLCVLFRHCQFAQSRHLVTLPPRKRIKKRTDMSTSYHVSQKLRNDLSVYGGLSAVLFSIPVCSCADDQDGQIPLSTLC